MKKYVLKIKPSKRLPYIKGEDITTRIPPAIKIYWERGKRGVITSLAKPRSPARLPNAALAKTGILFVLSKIPSTSK
jgi:hypothetical protein